MGQKVHPTGIRLGIVKDWTSTWYADSSNYADYLNMDLEIREFLRKRLSQASISRIQISRPAHNAVITIHTARPGIVIGKKGEDIDRLRKEVSARMGIPVNINIELLLSMVVLQRERLTKKKKKKQQLLLNLPNR